MQRQQDMIESLLYQVTLLTQKEMGGVQGQSGRGANSWGSERRYGNPVGILNRLLGRGDSNAEFPHMASTEERGSHSETGTPESANSYDAISLRVEKLSLSFKELKIRKKSGYAAHSFKRGLGYLVGLEVPPLSS